MTQPACTRCGGFFVMHTLDDQSIVIKAARCINCGNIVEPMMNAAKMLHAEGQQQAKERYRRKGTHYRTQPI